MMSSLSERFGQLTGRERGLLLLLVAVILPVALWFIVAEPLIEGRERAKGRLADARDLHAWVLVRDAEWSARSSDAPVARAPAAPVGLSGLEAALTAAGLRQSVAALENARDGGIVLKLDDVPFVELGAFMERAETELGYDLDNIRLTRGESAGSVAADLALKPEAQ